MSSTPDTRPVISHPEVDSVVVGVVKAGDRERQQEVAGAIVEHWRSVEWPDGLVAVNCFTSTQNDSVLTYEQWESEKALSASLDDERHPGRAPGSGATELVPYRLYKVVRGTAVGDPPPPANSFPVAAFPMESHEAARQWIEGLLKAEEAAALTKVMRVDVGNSADELGSLYRHHTTLTRAGA
ncbi:hypothetical protein ABZY05_25120 [Streptomyces canus]|uniref:hypothetical protein n=1 Tax=Streptomyces canus TaxID=58343 RepID=UPI0033AAA880